VEFARGDLDAAQRAYARAMELGDAAQAGYSLGLIQARRGHWSRGLDLMRQAADQPGASAAVLASVAWRLATHPEGELRDGPAALGYAQRAVEQSEGRDARALAALAAACAELGRFDDAVLWQQRALEMAPPGAQEDLQQALQTYREGHPFRTQ
jgi:tetratricopeptide (TPR) repeat protein